MPAYAARLRYRAACAATDSTAGSRARRRVTFFARPKKSHQKKGRPTEWVSNTETALRYSPAPGAADRTSMSCLRQARFPAGPLRAITAPAVLLGHSGGTSRLRAEDCPFFAARR